MATRPPNWIKKPKPSPKIGQPLKIKGK